MRRGKWNSEGAKWAVDSCQGEGCYPTFFNGGKWLEKKKIVLFKTNPSGLQKAYLILVVSTRICNF